MRRKAPAREQRRSEPPRGSCPSTRSRPMEMVTWRKKPAEPDALRQHWQEWTAIVEQFARRSHSRHRLEPQAYLALQQQLLELCRERAGTAPEKHRAHYQGLEDLVRPWLSLRVLELA